MKTLLVKAPEGKGYYLNQQVPSVFVSGRPHVVKNDSQVQLGSARQALIILGETEMTDEDFATAYAKDAKKAISDAVLDTEDADPDAAQKAAEAAKKEAAAKAKREKEEAARLKKEAADKKAAEEALAAEKAAKED